MNTVVSPAARAALLVAVWTFWACDGSGSGSGENERAVSGEAGGEAVSAWSSRTRVPSRPPFVYDPALGPITIPDEPLCASCRIEARVAFTVGALEGPGSLRGPGRVYPDALGRYWYSYYPPHGGAEIFGADGSFLRSIEATGRGPGELLTAYPIVPLPGDSTLVFDSGNRRALVFAPDLSPSRYVTVPLVPAEAVVLEWPTSVIVQGNLEGVGSVGLPLHEIGMSGSEATVLRSFGPPGRYPMFADRASIARSTEGYVWAINVSDYSIGLWDVAEARVVRSWVREAEWFHASRRVPSSAQSPVEDAAGRLWVLVNSARPGAEERLSEAIRGLFPNGMPDGPFDIPVSVLPPAQEQYRTTVEVLDVVSGRVHARTILEAFVIALLPGGRAVAYDEDDLGVPRLTFLALELRE